MVQISFRVNDFVNTLEYSKFCSPIIVFTVAENEEHVLIDILRYLHSSVSHVDISSKQEMVLSFPNLEIDLYHREVRRNEKVIRLTDLWSEEYAHEKGTIMSHIRHIRKKLESDESSFDYIENIRGVGYRFKKPMGLSVNTDF